MADSSLGDALAATREALQTLGIEDDLFRDVLAVRLLIERVGETDNNGWWESRVLAELGRDSLAEVTPKTRTKARIDLAQQVGRKVEREATPADALSLFYLGPTGEAQLDALLEEMDPDATAAFEALESLTASFDTAGWTTTLVDDPISPAGGSGAFEIESVAESELQDHEALRTAALSCFGAYGASTAGALRVPYISIET
jgi:hypothetical protein